MMMLAELIVSPAIQRERAKARRMGSLFLPEPKCERIAEPTPEPTPVPQVHKPSSSVVWITSDEAEGYCLERKPKWEIPATVQNSMSKIVKLVSRFYSIPEKALLSERKFKQHVHARHVVMYLAKTMTSRSYPDIGRRLGNRDHTTILFGVQKITRLRQSDSKLDAELIFFERELAAG